MDGQAIERPSEIIYEGVPKHNCTERLHNKRHRITFTLHLLQLFAEMYVAGSYEGGFLVSRLAPTGQSRGEDLRALVRKQRQKEAISQLTIHIKHAQTLLELQNTIKKLFKTQNECLRLHTRLRSVEKELKQRKSPTHKE